MKKTVIGFILLLIFTTFLTGCKNNPSPKDIMLQALDKEEEIKSSTFHGHAEILFESGIESLHLNFKGKKINNPMQLEANLWIEELKMDLNIQMNDNKLYIKLPTLMTNYFADLSNKYLYIDLTETLLASLQLDQENQVNLERALVEGLEDNAFVLENAKNYSIEDGEVTNVVSIKLTEQDLSPFLQSISGTNQQFEFNNIKMTSVLDKNSHERRSLIEMEAVFHQEQENELVFKINMEQNLEDLNKEIVFEMPIPRSEQLIRMEELEQMFNMGMNIQ